jgi:hypothetical protein
MVRNDSAKVVLRRSEANCLIRTRAVEVREERMLVRAFDKALTFLLEQPITRDCPLSGSLVQKGTGIAFP